MKGEQPIRRITNRIVKRRLRGVMAGCGNQCLMSATVESAPARRSARLTLAPRRLAGLVASVRPDLSSGKPRPAPEKQNSSARHASDGINRRALPLCMTKAFRSCRAAGRPYSAAPAKVSRRPVAVFIRPSGGIEDESVQSALHLIRDAGIGAGLAIGVGMLLARRYRELVQLRRQWRQRWILTCIDSLATTV